MSFAEEMGWEISRELFSSPPTIGCLHRMSSLYPDRSICFENLVFVNVQQPHRCVCTYMNRYKKSRYIYIYTRIYVYI